MEQIETSDNPKLTLDRLLVSRDLPCAMRSMQQASIEDHMLMLFLGFLSKCNLLEFKDIIIWFVPQEVRYCSECYLIKPDRAHHCSVCRKCVLKVRF